MVRFRRRAGAFLLAFAVSLGGAVAGASPARADDASAWLPSIWIKAVVGTVAQARAVFGGDTTSYIGGAQVSYGDFPEGSCDGRSGCTESRFLPTVVGNAVQLRLGVDYCAPGVYDVCNWDGPGRIWPGGLVNGQLVVGGGPYMYQIGARAQCVHDGSVWSDREVTVDSAGWWTATDMNTGFCTSLVSMTFTRQGNLRPTRVGFDSSEQFTTEVTCRSLATGADNVVSETATGTAPAPVCPAGSYAVRTKIISSTRGILQDASVSVPNGAEDYLANPSNWQWQVWLNGLPCIAGSAACDAWIADGVFPPNGDCVILDKGGPSTFSVSLPKTECEDWRAGGGQFINDPGSDGDGDNGLKVAIDRVVQAVQQWGKSISDGIGRLGKAIGDGIGVIKDKLTSLVECPAGSNCQVVAEGGGNGVKDGFRDELADKFSPWTDAWGDLIGGFDVGSPGCSGPAWSIGKPLYITVQPFDACSEPMASVAAVFKAALSVVCVVGGLMGCTRVLLASIGLQIGKGSTEDGA